MVQRWEVRLLNAYPVLLVPTVVAERPCVRTVRPARIHLVAVLGVHLVPMVNTVHHLPVHVTRVPD